MHSPVEGFYRENPQPPTEKYHKSELRRVELLDAPAGQLRFDHRGDELVGPRFSRAEGYLGILERDNNKHMF